MYSSKLEDIMVECSLLLVMTQLSLEHSEPALSSQFHSFFCAFVFSKLFTLVSNYYGFSTNQQKNILVISSNCVLQHLFILIDFFSPQSQVKDIHREIFIHVGVMAGILFIPYICIQQHMKHVGLLNISRLQLSLST